MSFWHGIILICSSFIAGIVNAVAGGGALIIYPLLLSLGISPINANATSAANVWPSSLSSAFGYRKHLKKLPKHYYWLLLPSALGGLLGAIILKRTSNHTFELIVPWFIVFAVVLLALQPKLHAWLYTRKNRKIEKKHRRLILAGIAVVMFALATYGGYFGAGIGIIILAFLGLTELSDIQQMNGLKNLAGVSINLVASVYFVAVGLVDWSAIPYLLVGGIIGGWIGSHYASKLPSAVIRLAIIVIGVVVAIALFRKVAV